MPSRLLPKRRFLGDCGIQSGDSWGLKSKNCVYLSSRSWCLYASDIHSRSRRNTVFVFSEEERTIRQGDAEEVLSLGSKLSCQDGAFLVTTGRSDQITTERSKHDEPFLSRRGRSVAKPFSRRGRSVAKPFFHRRDVGPVPGSFT